VVCEAVIPVDQLVSLSVVSPLRLDVGDSFFRVWSRSRHWWGSTARTVDRSINGDVGGEIVVMDNLQDGRVCVSYLASCRVG
jgi:hypothetical protein